MSRNIFYSAVRKIIRKLQINEVLKIILYSSKDVSR